MANRRASHRNGQISSDDDKYARCQMDIIHEDAMQILQLLKAEVGQPMCCILQTLDAHCSFQDPSSFYIAFVGKLKRNYPKANKHCQSIG